MLSEYLKPKQKVIYWSPMLNRHVLDVVYKKTSTQVILENGVKLPFNKILCIQGAE